MVALRVEFSPPVETVQQRFARLKEHGFAVSIGRVAQEADEMILGALVEEAPKRTGHFAGTLHSTQTATGNGITMTYRGEDPLMSWILHGTPPHVIEARQGGVLAFMAASGDVVFATHVNHPGTQPNDFVGRAWSSVQGDVADLLVRGGREFLMDLLGD